MTLSINDIFLSYNESLEKYLTIHKSKHWDLNYQKKKNYLKKNI